jgi:hypothetical protein
MSQSRIDELDKLIREPSKLDFNPIIFSSTKKVVQKVAYLAHAASVYSDEEAASVIKSIGSKVKRVDAIPFAIRVLDDSGQPRQYNEDNGDWGVGDSLAELLELDGAMNTILVVTRVVSGCFPSDSIQTVKFSAIKETALGALTLLSTHIQIEADRKAAEQATRNKFIQDTELSMKSQQEEIDRRIETLHSQISDKESTIKKYSEVAEAFAPQKKSFEDLVEKINGIEKEKDKLEGDIEKAEDHSHPSAEPAEVSMDEMKKRYFLIKEQLVALRQERKGHEQDYNKIMKDLKHLENLVKSLSSLKVALLEAMKVRDLILADYQHFKSEFLL